MILNSLLGDTCNVFGGYCSGGLSECRSDLSDSFKVIGNDTIR